MFTKRKLVLTATTCEILENLRLSIEVLKGVRVRFKHVQLERGLQSGSASVYLLDGEQETEETVLAFMSSHTHELRFQFGTRQYFRYSDDTDWFFSRMDCPSTVRVIGANRTSGEVSVWRVGRSFHDRWEEPL